MMKILPSLSKAKSKTQKAKSIRNEHSYENKLQSKTKALYIKEKELHTNEKNVYSMCTI